MDTQKDKSAFQFTNPELVRSIFVTSEEYEVKKTETFKMNVEPSLGKLEDVDDNTRMAEVILSVHNTDINGKGIEEELKEKPYVVFITMKAYFRWSKDSIKKKDEEHYLKINAASLLLSYIRPLLSQLTGMSRFNIQTIPFIDFTSMADSEKN